MRKPISIPMSRFARNPESIAKDIDASGAVYCIKRPGGRRMMMMDAEYFEGWRIVIALMQQPNWREELEQGRRDAQAGRGVTLEELEAELGLDRPAHSRRRRTAAPSPRASRAKSTRRAKRTRGRSQ